MDIINAIKKPFTDWKKFLIGFLLGIIPIVNFILIGYGLEVIKNTLNKNKKLPEWKNFGQKFVQGLVAILIGIIYAIPLGIFAIVSLGVPAMMQMMNVSATGMMDFSIFAGLGPVIIALIILAILTTLVQKAAIVRYAEKRKFSAAFDFSIVFRKGFSGSFILAVVAATAYSAILSFAIAFLSAMVPFVFVGLLAFILTITANTLLAEGYRAAK